MEPNRFGIIKGVQPLIRASRASKVAGAFPVSYTHLHAGHILKTLACYHHRHTAVFQRLRQLRSIIAAQQDDARHVVCLLYTSLDLVQHGIAHLHLVDAALDIAG